jgi:hypothetical protein
METPAGLRLAYHDVTSRRPEAHQFANRFNSDISVATGGAQKRSAHAANSGRLSKKIMPGIRYKFCGSNVKVSSTTPATSFMFRS